MKKLYLKSGIGQLAKNEIDPVKLYCSTYTHLTIAYAYVKFQFR